VNRHAGVMVWPDISGLHVKLAMLNLAGILWIIAQEIQIEESRQPKDRCLTPDTQDSQGPVVLDGGSTTLGFGYAAGDINLCLHNRVPLRKHICVMWQNTSV